MSERPKPNPYGTGEDKDDKRNSEQKPAQMPGSQSNPSQSKNSPHSRP